MKFKEGEIETDERKNCPDSNFHMERSRRKLGTPTMEGVCLTIRPRRIPFNTILSPVGTGFLGEFFSGFFLTCKGWFTITREREPERERKER